MKKKLFFLSAFPAALLIAALAVGQSVPHLVNYQGRLLDSLGAPVEGSVDMIFSFYTAPGPEASLLLSAAQDNVSVSGGVYNVLIGSGTITAGAENSLAKVFENHSEVWLGVSVNGDPEMTPRAKVLSVPYSILAGKVDGRWLDAYLSNPDSDGDGRMKMLWGGTDCDDSNPAIYPGATELCDGLDNQCPGDSGYGLIDEGCTNIDQMLRAAVNDLIYGVDDYAAISADLQQVMLLDPVNPNPMFFKAIADFMEKVRQSAMGEGSSVCDFKDLYTRAGYYNVNEDTGGFWDIELDRQVTPFFCLGGCTAATGCQVLKNKRNYLFCPQQMSWQNARDFCRSYGGDLAAINGSGEDEWVAMQLAQSTWIGYNRLDYEWEYEWSNGDDPDYDNWVWGFPMMMPGNSCAEMDAGWFFQWDEMPCSNTLGFVCEEVVDRSEGDVPVGAPTSDEYNQFMNNCTIPYLEDLLADLESVPEEFDYALLNVDAGGTYFDGNPTDDTAYYWLDYGDATMLKGALHQVLAELKTADAYNWDNVEFNDFDTGLGDTVDELGLIETKYTSLGLLHRPARLTAAKDHMVQAYQYWVQGMDDIFTEGDLACENGLLTLCRNSELYGTTAFTLDPDGFYYNKLWDGFHSEEDRDRFPVDEAYFRAWAQGIIDAFSVDVDYSFDQVPGGTVDPNREAVMNFYKFWAGIDFRDTYMKTITDPFDGYTTLGVTDLQQLDDPDMLTFLGVVKKWNGVAPAPGDLQYEDYALRVDTPHIDTKIIDGLTTDWDPATNSTLVGLQPNARIEWPRPDIGDIYVAVDDFNLYIMVTTDIWNFYFYDIFAESQGDYSAGIQYDFFWGIWDFWMMDPISWFNSPSMFEMAIPLTNFFGDEWVEIRTDAETWDGRWFERESIYVKLRPGTPPDAAVSCGESVTGNTSGSIDDLNNYSCIGWNESGPDYVYQIMIGSTIDVTATLSNLGADLDVFILGDDGGQAKADNCLEYGDLSAKHRDAPPGTYHIVVDGYDGAQGAYTLTVTCP
jgi:hypothetical protein